VHCAISFIEDGLATKAITYNPLITKHFFDNEEVGNLNYRIYNPNDSLTNPMNHNMFINAYRWMGKERRAPTPHPEVRRDTPNMQNLAGPMHHMLEPFKLTGGAKIIADTMEGHLAPHGYLGKNRLFLLTFGTEVVRSIIVRRYPLPDAMQKTIEDLTSGEWSKMKKRIPYDDIYHASMVINHHLLMEKNEVLNFTTEIDHYPHTEQFEIRLPADHHPMTIYQMIERTHELMGDKMFHAHPLK
jgi:hypothetical protein